MTTIDRERLIAVAGGHHDTQAPASPLNSELWQCVLQANEAVAAGRIKPGYMPSCLHLLPNAHNRNQQ